MLIIQKVEDLGDSVYVNDSVTVPKDEANGDYQAVLKFINNGGILGTNLINNAAKERKRSERDSLLRSTQDRVDRYNRYSATNANQIDDITKLYGYIEYLTSFPDQTGEWWSMDILNYENWLAANP